MRWIFRTITILIGVSFAIACMSAEVTPTEMEMFVRGKDLVDVGIEVSNPEKYEKFSKINYFDGSQTIEYEFEPPESESVMYLTVSVTYEPKKSDAKLGQVAEDSVIGLLLKAQGLEKVDVPNFYEYGDSCNFYHLKKDGEKVGNYFTVLEDRKIYSLLISGVYFDDVETWREIVEPKLRLFASYKPR